jgi:photosystem II stability/assembly factor-like uncharacterized protein
MARVRPNRIATNRIGHATAVLATVVACGATAGVALASGLPLGPPVPPPAITAAPINRVPGTLKPGRVVGSTQLGHRVFVDARHGFALASVGQAQYPAASVDAGRTWRVSGPALHLNAAQAPFAVCEVGALSRLAYFADGCGGVVVDSTSDGGAHWSRASLGGTVLGVVATGARLTAFVHREGSLGPGALVYVSTDGGRHWRRDENPV